MLSSIYELILPIEWNFLEHSIACLLRSDWCNQFSRVAYLPSSCVEFWDAHILHVFFDKKLRNWPSAEKFLALPGIEHWVFHDSFLEGFWNSRWMCMWDLLFLRELSKPFLSNHVWVYTFLKVPSKRVQPKWYSKQAESCFRRYKTTSHQNEKFFITQVS